MLQAALVRRGLSAFLVVPLLRYVETRSLSVQGLGDRLRPAGLGPQLVPGGAFTPEELEVLFQADLTELSLRLRDSQRTSEWGM
eukprot:11467900-Alexandrium_andersonii.AAC.1